MKKKTILYLEDNASFNRRTVEKLNERLETTEYYVEGFYRIDQANDFIEKILSNEVNTDLCCIITDLNMNDQWLGEYRFESEGNLFSGWVWLDHFVFDVIENIPIVIYSAYKSDLKEHLQKKNELEKLNERNIHLVRKGGNDSDGLIVLYNVIKEMLKF